MTNQIDRHIGNMVKLRRTVLNVSQYSLSYDLRISFQQLQKYESGQNKISSSRLYQIAGILKVSPHFFFEGLSGVKTSPDFPRDIKTLNAIEIMKKIKNQKVKNKIINLIMELAVA